MLHTVGELDENVCISSIYRLFLHLVLCGVFRKEEGIYKIIVALDLLILKIYNTCNQSLIGTEKLIVENYFN